VAASLADKSSPSKARQHLRQFLVGTSDKAPYYDRDSATRELSSSKRADFGVELMLVRANASNSAARIRELVGWGEVATAELLCARFPTPEAVVLICRSLNRAGFKDEESYHEKLLGVLSVVGPDIDTLLTSYPDIIPREMPSHLVIRRLLAPAMAKSLYSAETSSLLARLSGRVAEKSASHLSRQLNQGSFRLDAEALCHLCHRPMEFQSGEGLFPSSGIVRYPLTGVLAHRRCYERS